MKEIGSTSRPSIGVGPWIILAIASAGWLFDVFEGQLFNITRNSMLHDLLGGSEDAVRFWGDVALAVFLLGGTIGGVLFGSLADRLGRRPVMAVTILCYSIFSFLTCLATHLWQILLLRFLVALGVGGEWAVAASLVAEVFPAGARARAGGIFHATSVIGTWLAAILGMIVAARWRFAYAVSALPALLLFVVRAKVREPERWRRAEAGSRPMGSFREMFRVSEWARRAILGLLLAAVGLGTFWSVVVAGQDLTRDLLLRHGVNPALATERARFAYGVVQTLGMGVGLLCFGPVAERLGRRGTFLLWHLGAAAIVPITCLVPHSYGQMLAVLPLFGFLTGGIHAGYAIYFPELFPDHLRATGSAVCFNGGRLLAATMLWASAELKTRLHGDLRRAVMLLGLTFLLGAFLTLFLPETRGRSLPE